MVNAPGVVRDGVRIAEAIFGKRNVKREEPVMGGEDFSYFLQNVPGAMFLLGASKSSRPTPHHNATFDIDESVLIRGVEFLCRFTVDHLKKHSRV